MISGTQIVGTLAGIGAVALTYFGALRERHMRWGATDAELKADLPGDELLPTPAAQVTHAITIHAAPEQVWPWIMQIGQDRSGFYSYTWAENLIGCDMPKVERIEPAWSPRTAGETVWFATPKHFEGKGKMIAAIVRPERAFAMVSATDWVRVQNGEPGSEAVWAFILKSAPAGQTRLIVRLRSGPAKNFVTRLANLFFWEPAHFVMERKMLRTIKTLAEGTPVLAKAA